MFKEVIIGIDQSYTRTGIAIAADGKLKLISSINFKGTRSKSGKRKFLANTLLRIFKKAKEKGTRCLVICERIRMFSGKQPFISLNYVKSTAALIAVIVDVAEEFEIPVFSVDTRSWKSKVLGKSVKEKQVSIDFVEKLGFNCSNDDEADAACIALYGFLKDKKIILEK